MLLKLEAFLFVRSLTRKEIVNLVSQKYFITFEELNLFNKLFKLIFVLFRISFKIRFGFQK